MSENSQEVPRADRKKVAKFYPVIPNAEGYSSKQENFQVEYSGAERTEIGWGSPHFNVKKPKLEK